MNIVVIHNAGIETYKSWRQLENDTSFKREDFANIGVDFVLNTTGDTYEIAKDVKLIERVASQRVFSKDRFDTSNWLQILILVFALLIYTKV